MMMLAVMMLVMVAVPVSAAFGLERCRDRLKMCPEAAEHVLDHVVGPNPKNLILNFSRQMPIAQVPRKAHELDRIFMSDFYEVLGSSLNLQPPAIVQLQSISVGHGNRLRKIEENIVALICRQSKAAAVARVKVESKRACRLFLRPLARREINCSTMHGHLST
jgi:hypothetical protein